MLIKPLLSVLVQILRVLLQLCIILLVRLIRIRGVVHAGHPRARFSSRITLVALLLLLELLLVVTDESVLRCILRQGLKPVTYKLGLNFLHITRSLMM